MARQLPTHADLVHSRRVPVKFVIPVLALLAAPASANDFHVFDGDSIQSAIDVATDGDRIFAHRGTYAGNLTFKGKDIQIIGVFGAENTTILGGPYPAVRFDSGEPLTAMLKGFTIGAITSVSSAVVVVGSGATIEDCTILGGDAFQGGGVFADTSQLLLSGCLLQSCRAGEGGGLYLVPLTKTLTGSQV